MKPAALLSLLMGLGTLFTPTAPLSAAAPQPPRPVGAEIAVNTAVFGSHSEPKPLLFSDGGFAVVWTDTGQKDGVPKGAVHARFFLADGTPASGEFRLTAPSASSSVATSAVVDRDDSFLIAWDDTPPGLPTRVLVQRFSRAGQPVGPALQVSAANPASRFGGHLALRPGGGFALAWSAVEDHVTHTDDSGDIYATDVYARLYTAAGAALGPEFLVNGYTFDEQFAKGLAVSANGALNVIYLSWDGEQFALRLRRLAPKGRPLGEGIAVSSSPSSVQGPSALSMAPDGTFFVAWSEVTAGSAIHARRFAADGSPLTADFLVDIEGPHHDVLGGLTTLPNGGAVVVWADRLLVEGEPTGVYGRAFGPDGKPLSAHAFLVNRTTTGAQFKPAIVGRNGRFVVAWGHADREGVSKEIRARALTSN